MQILFDNQLGRPEFRINDQSAELSRIYGGTYNPATRSWSFPAFYPHGTFVLHDMELVVPFCAFSAEADSQRTLLRAQETQMAAFDAGVWTMPHPWDAMEYNPPLFNHQKRSLYFASVNYGAWLLLEPGLGKSAVIVHLIRYLKRFTNESSRTLVLAPKVVLYNWQAEVAKHSQGDLSCTVVTGDLPRKRDILTSNADVTVMTYDTLAGDYAFTTKERQQHPEVAKQSFLDAVVATGKYGVLVADESHNLMSPTSHKTKATVTLARKIPRRIAMTGSATLGHPLHLWGQFKFLGDNQVEEYWPYRNKFCTINDGPKKYVIGFKNMDLLQRRLDRVSVIYKTTDCLDLPELRVLQLTYRLEGDQQDRYNALVQADTVDLSLELGVPEQAVAALRVNKLLQVCSGFEYDKQVDGSRLAIRYKTNPKLDLTMNLLEDILATPTSKVIVWAKFTEELDILAEAFKDKGYSYVRVDGSVNAKETLGVVDRFNNDPLTQIYLGQIATGIGINLTAANYVIYFATGYDLGHYTQSNRRSWRIGQERPVTVYHLLGLNSIEEFVSLALAQKQDIARTLSSKIVCTSCPEYRKCLVEGIEPFDSLCIYKSDSDKQRTRLKVV